MKKIFMLCLVSVLSLTSLCSVGEPQEKAQQILNESGVTGGLVVHVGCGDGKLTAALHADDSFVVQGLDANPANVAKATSRSARLCARSKRPVTTDISGRFAGASKETRRSIWTNP